MMPLNKILTKILWSFGKSHLEFYCLSVILLKSGSSITTGVVSVTVYKDWGATLSVFAIEIT